MWKIISVPNTQRIVAYLLRNASQTLGVQYVLHTTKVVIMFLKFIFIKRLYSPV